MTPTLVGDTKNLHANHIGKSEGPSVPIGHSVINAKPFQPKGIIYDSERNQCNPLGRFKKKI